ncbi:MAG: glutamate synthase large subunit [Alphaproteobacteria bacterium]|nr:glutamate synthase large subunit [Alphaproteobacteria bacterium]
MKYSWSDEWNERAAKLSAEGLYDSANEHDACGVGFVASIHGTPSRAIVEAGITALKAVYHRGAVDADGKTGDGAGIHVEIPHDFFQEQITNSGRALLNDMLAVGMMFLPKKKFAAQEACRSIVEAEIVKFGYRLYGWRQVPVHAEVIGEIASDSRPEIEQILIAGRDGEDEKQFELNLYFIRKRIEKAVRAQAINDFYICSLSCRSVIYKGLFKAEQLTAFYPDLLDPRFISSFAIFHQRFSTNTAPAWHLAQPFRMIAHNGEINTLRGNINFMRSHEATFSCPEYEGYLEDIVPVIPDNTSDTGALDAVFEVLTRAGRPLPLSKLILIPPAWAQTPDVPLAHKEMYSFLNSLSEQWDGPAAIAATDGEWVIGGLDRNGLRPLRYTITKDGMIVAASESGMVDVADTDIALRGRLGPGDILGIHLPSGKLYRDQELKDHLASQYPYGKWVTKSTRLKDLPAAPGKQVPAEKLRILQLAAGYTHEDVEAIIHPMAADGKEAVGSMGDDTPLAVLSDRTRGFHHFFRQNFSQVTNPPIDSLRERRVMSLTTRFGNDGNFLALDSTHSKILVVDSPVLLAHEMAAIGSHFAERIAQIDTVFDALGEKNALRKGLDEMIEKAEAAIKSGKNYILLTDEKMDENNIAIPMILAISALQSRLVKLKLRKRTSILVRTSECFDVHAAAVMIGAGATVIHPYVAEATVLERAGRGLLKNKEEAVENFREAMNQGLLKIMSKMGISIIAAYRGGLNFEAIGLSRSFVSEFFPGLPSRISGIGLAGIEERVRTCHTLAFSGAKVLPLGGFYRARAREEIHAWEGRLTHLLQSAVTKGSFTLFKQYSKGIQDLPPVSLRDLLDFRSPNAPVDIDTVESITEIRKRFVAPAMSLGALSKEAHETLAIAMNKMGAASNSGEGGEGPERYKPLENGDNANSTIKQIASGRFGVTAEYLNSAHELQIKVAQGAKPGEGGQLPGFKVTAEIARLRHATPGVMLISPPPHHDIYSIEDLAQLIYDLKQINPTALVSVKLVAQSGIGTIASGVAKAMADKIVIAGHSGGTGASPWSSVKHAGIPWEMGLAEANQVLTLNRMRHRVKLQTDGGLKTGRDIVIAAMLGAEEFALGTASLVAMGCILVRQCHMNTCPVGITTQDPALRAKFDGTVEKVINLFSFVAEEVREILATLGFTHLNDIIGRTDLLRQVSRGGNNLVDLDLNNILAQADSGGHARYCTLTGRNEVPETLDSQMIKDAAEALAHGGKIQLAYTVRNTMRTIGARLSSELVRNHADKILHDDYITLRLRGSAGQSLGAFATRGIRIELLGDANDYVGKGLSGATIIVRPRPSSPLVPQDNTIIGNTVLYGATAGKLFACGQAGERFAVRNSGASAVIEGCGSNGCEYMTGGVAVILGGVGHNFAAGMTGGMAFVYDASGHFENRVNTDTVLVQRIESQHWQRVLKALIEEHFRETASPLADAILAGWDYEFKKFHQICPKEMVERLEQPLTDVAAKKARR